MKTVLITCLICIAFSALDIITVRADENPYFRSELIFEPEKVDIKQCHGSTLVELPGGDILAAYYGGDYEKAKNVAVYGARLGRGETKWSEPWILHDTPDKSEGNPVLWFGPDNKLWLFFVTIMKDNWNQALIFFKKSPDRGKTWSEPVQMLEREGWMTRNKPLQLKNGYILLPIYNEVLFDSEFLISGNGGRKWKMSSVIRSPGTNLQPTVVQLSDGSLLAGMRTGSKNGLMWWSRSKNNGKKWSKPYTTDVRNPHSACDMVMLADGHIALAYNDSPDNRNTLTVALSTDEGKTWSAKRNLEYKKGEEFSYPAIITTSDNLIHVTYTYKRVSIKHAVFNEAWITAAQ